MYRGQSEGNPIEIEPSVYSRDDDEHDEYYEHQETDSPKNLFSSQGANEFSEALTGKEQPEEQEETDNTQEKYDTYRETLEQKVRNQAQRLCQLQEYKSLCERRIMQLSPGHQLPILESHFDQGGNREKNYSAQVQHNNSLQSLKFQVKELMNKVVSKDNELDSLNKRYENLVTKYNNMMKETVPKSLVASMNKQIGISTNEYVFPGPERVANEKMRDAYGKLHQTYKELVIDREKILDSLRDETIINEEQRNYIEILKQTIESSLLKHGLSSIMKKQLQKYYSGKENLDNCDTTDVLIDVVSLKNEVDRTKKEQVKSEMLVNELRLELDFLKETNEEMNSKKEKIKKSLENGITELEEAKEKLHELELEKNFYVEEYNSVKEYNEKIMRDYEACLEMNREYEQRLQHSSDLNEHSMDIEKKLIEYKENFAKLNDELDNLLAEKEKIEEGYKKAEEEAKKSKGEVSELTKSVEELTEKCSRSKKHREKIEMKNDELNQNLNENLKLLSQSEKEVGSLNSELNQIRQEFKQFRESHFNCEDNKKEGDNSLKEIKEKLKKVQLENDKYKVESNDYSKNFDRLLKQYEQLNKEFKSLEEKYQKAVREKEDLLKELTDYKGKVSSDDFGKTKEYNKLNSNFMALRKEKQEIEIFLNDEINKLKEELKRTLAERNEAEQQMREEYANQKQRADELCNQKNDLEVEIIEKNKYIGHLEEKLSPSSGRKQEQQKNSESQNYKEEYQTLRQKYEKVVAELKSYKNDNKKLFDHNKRLKEENSKLQILERFYKFMRSLLLKLIRLPLFSEVASVLGELVNCNDVILNLEVDKLNIGKRIVQLEKEISRQKGNEELRAELSGEMVNLDEVICSYERKIEEKKIDISNLEKELHKGEHSRATGTAKNVFRSNYVEQKKSYGEQNDENQVPSEDKQKSRSSKAYKSEGPSSKFYRKADK